MKIKRKLQSLVEFLTNRKCENCKYNSLIFCKSPKTEKCNSSIFPIGFEKKERVSKMRDRLIKLLKQAEKQQSLNAVCGDIDSLIDSPKGAEFIADYLLANGVVALPCNAKGTVPPCTVGDTVYRVEILFGEVMISELKVVELTLDNKGIKALRGMTKQGSFYCFNRGYNLDDIRFTEEEAERALKGGE